MRKGLAERAQRFREQVEIENGEIGDVQLAGFAAAETLDGLNAFFCQGKHAFGIDEKGAALLGEINAAFGAVEQANAEFLFEIENLARERRLGQMEAFSGPGEVELLGHRDEIPHMAQLHTPRIARSARIAIA